MAHVPDEFVLGRVEDAVQRDGQLDHAEVRADMAAGLGQAGDEFLPDFAGEVLQLRQREFLQCAGPFTISRYVLIKFLSANCANYRE